MSQDMVKLAFKLAFTRSELSQPVNWQSFEQRTTTVVNASAGWVGLSPHVDDYEVLWSTGCDLPLSLFLDIK